MQGWKHYTSPRRNSNFSDLASIIRTLQAIFLSNLRSRVPNFERFDYIPFSCKLRVDFLPSRFRRGCIIIIGTSVSYLEDPCQFLDGEEWLLHVIL
ncbi:hypothetical protein K1719_011933 [Acacia pycnantha]|nr:hypothetical protein K1719_011933 [Acacia pycnantha]